MTRSGHSQDRLPRPWSSPRARLLLLGAVVAGGSGATIAFGGLSRDEVTATVESAGAFGPLVFVLLYALLTVLLFPGAVITAAGGVLFGVALGTVLALLGATLGATAAFLIGRRLGRRQVEAIAGRRIGAVDRRLERRGFLALVYLRLIPLVPFNALNYVAGTSAVKRRDYVLGTAIGIIPGAFAYAALGSSLDDLTSPEFFAAVALVIVLAVTAPLVDRLLRRRGRQPIDSDES